MNTGSSQFGDDRLKAGYDPRQAVIIELVRGILRRVVVGIAERSSVCYHNCRITLSPERPVVRPGDAGKDFRKSASLRWKLTVVSKRRHDPVKYFAG